ncbi:MAG: hypothetical protein M1358_08800 [Chloroflexi bacterium]|nr:hypothetical protein [Chloroflexota bacterium]
MNRKQFRMLDPQEEDFASGGLSQFLADRSARLLILPGDPDAPSIEFDSEFWSWWLGDCIDPATGRPARWGRNSRPTSMAAVRGEFQNDDQDWRYYMALLRCGGLDKALGRAGFYRLRQGRAFRLIAIVGRIWATLDLYREAVERFGVHGPWEITLALSGTAGSLLGHLAEGWAEPDTLNNDMPPCREPGVLLRKEIAQLPDIDGARAIAFSFGAWLEDTWGVRQRRFLARCGQLTDQFDKENYQRSL